MAATLIFMKMSAPLLDIQHCVEDCIILFTIQVTLYLGHYQLTKDFNMICRTSCKGPLCMILIRVTLDLLMGGKRWYSSLFPHFT